MIIQRASRAHRLSLRRFSSPAPVTTKRKSKRMWSANSATTSAAAAMRFVPPITMESCQETVPQAIIAFLESTSFEDALRTAVSLGGDSDTLAAITGSIAEAFYGVPEELRQECRKRLTPELAEILRRWESALYNEKNCGRI